MYGINAPLPLKATGWVLRLSGKIKVLWGHASAPTTTATYPSHIYLVMQRISRHWLICLIFKFPEARFNLGRQRDLSQGVGRPCVFMNVAVKSQDSELMKRFPRAHVVRIRIKANCRMKMLRAVKCQLFVNWNVYICVVCVHSEAYKIQIPLRW
jgi:hypothetical protein